MIEVKPTHTKIKTEEQEMIDLHEDVKKLKIENYYNKRYILLIMSFISIITYIIITISIYNTIIEYEIKEDIFFGGILWCVISLIYFKYTIIDIWKE